MNNQTSNEAARHLYSTLVLGPEYDSYEHGTYIMADPDYEKYIRNIEFKGSNRVFSWAYLRTMIYKLQTHRLISISLTNLELDEADYLLTDHMERAGFLASAEHLTLHIKSIGETQIFSRIWNERLSQGCRTLSSQMLSLRTLQLGFDRVPAGLLSRDATPNRDVTKSLLSQNFAKLTTLKLGNIVTTEQDLANFANRHYQTLESITVRGLYLPGAGGPQASAFASNSQHSQYWALLASAGFLWADTFTTDAATKAKFTSSLQSKIYSTNLSLDIMFAGSL